MSDTHLDPADRAYQLVNGFRAAQVVRAAIGLGVFERIDSGTATAAGLAESLGLEPQRVARLLRALVALGLLARSEDGSFRCTPVGEQFVASRRTLPRAQALMLMPGGYHSWAHFEESLRSGRTGHSLAFGEDRWSTLERSPAGAAAFNEVMVIQSERIAAAVASTVDLAEARVVVDVGGGNGALVAGLLLAHPHLRGIVCDLPAGLAGGDAYLRERHLEGRCELLEADFFESLPAGDVYFLKNIVHDWDDERAAAILATCRRSIADGGRIVLVERLMPAHVTDSPQHLAMAMLDLQMTVELGGRERTEDEYRALLEAAGFRFLRTTRLEHFSVLEAAAR